MSTDTLQVGRISVPLSNTDKTLFPADGITKADLIEYYREIADRMLPYVRERPLMMVRYPEGIDGERIVQKKAADYFPDWIRRVRVGKRDGHVDHVVCGDAATLVYLANQACIEPHIFLSRLDDLDHPDQLVFDLDPPDLAHFGEAREAALALHELLDGLNVTAFTKTTGGNGIHVHVPLDRGADFDDVRQLARDLADLLAERDPDRLTIQQRKDKRGNRLYLDVMRNAYAQTVIAPYGVRARPGAPVATPLHWDELSDPDLDPSRFTIRTIAERLKHLDDPWTGLSRHRQSPTRILKHLKKAR